MIDFGAQALSLPWSDPRSPMLTPYHGQNVVTGLRPDVLTPAGRADGDAVLRGRVHSLEYHGHEWLARLEMGLHLVDVGAAVHQQGGHRRADLLVRLDAPRDDWAAGREGSGAVDVPRVFFFDTDGRRIDGSPPGKQLFGPLMHL